MKGHGRSLLSKLKFKIAKRAKNKFSRPSACLNLFCDDNTNVKKPFYDAIMTSNSKKLEKAAFVRYIHGLNLRGIGAAKTLVQDLANGLLAERGGKAVDKHYVDNFRARTSEI